MPIIEINMLPINVEENIMLRNEIVKAVCKVKDLKNILPDEIMLNVVPCIDSCAGNFAYIKIWLYKKEERSSKILKQLQENIGNVVFDFAKRNNKNFNMVEVLPINLLSEVECFVKMEGTE